MTLTINLPPATLEQLKAEAFGEASSAGGIRGDVQGAIPYLNLAIAAQAPFLVSRDNDLLELWLVRVHDNSPSQTDVEPESDPKLPTHATRRVALAGMHPKTSRLQIVRT